MNLESDKRHHRLPPDSTADATPSGSPDRSGELQAVGQTQVASRTVSEGVLTLRDFLDFCWRSRWLLLFMMAICTVAAVVVVLVTPRKYEANVLLYPVSNQSGSGALGALGSAVSSLGGLASLAGLNLTASGGAKAEAVATLQSEALTERYIRDNDLLPVLFSDDWDPAQKKWKTNRAGKIPTLWRGNRYFEGSVRKVLENAKTGLVTLTITWKDPKVAAQWANDLIKLTNDYLRDKAIDEAERNIGYLNEQAAKTNVVEVHKAIYTLMESEIKKEMLARGSKEYALKVIDPAVAPEKQSYPRPLLWTAAGTLLGLMLGLFAAAIRQALGYGVPVGDRASK